MLQTATIAKIKQDVEKEQKNNRKGNKIKNNYIHVHHIQNEYKIYSY